MILTDEEVHANVNEYFYEGMEPTGRHYARFTRALEKAVLDKLKQQVPVAWHHPEEGLSYENHYSDNIPLYAAPMPDSDVEKQRDQFAMAAMAAFISCNVYDAYDIPKLSFMMADAMLAAREKGGAV